jgi:hypothetical protein
MNNFIFTSRSKSKAALQWSPTLTAHDPNPPISLESPSSGATIVEADFASSGTTTALAVGAAIFAGVYSSDGAAAVSGASATVSAAIYQSAGVAVVDGVGCAVFESVFNAAGAATASGQVEDIGSPTTTIPPTTVSPGGVDEAMHAVFYRGPEWSHELDEDELIEIISTWLMVK